VDEFGPEDLQAFPQFFDLVLSFFFYGGRFMKTVTDVDVHERLGLLTKSRNQVLPKPNCTPGSKKASGELDQNFS
jgi:hypothetical protein